MTRYFLWLVVLVAVVLSAAAPPAAASGELISEPSAATHGLASGWFNQIQLDSARGQVAYVTLHDAVQRDAEGVLHNPTLFVQTNQGVLHAIDAINGRTLWIAQVGNPNYPSLAPGANNFFVAVTNGSSLYVLNRFNGKQLFSTKLPGAPGAGPALSGQRVYVPMLDGLVCCYRLQPVKDALQELGKTDDRKKTPEEKRAAEAERHESLRLKQDVVVPLTCRSLGRTVVQPLITLQNDREEQVSWPTDKGFLYVCAVKSDEDRLNVRFRLETAAGISAQPVYIPPDPRILPDSGIIITGSRDAFLHAIKEKDGAALWRFSAGDPIVEAPVVIGTRLFAPTQFGGMFCLDAKTGNQLWWAPQIMRFLAASKNRVYAIDKLGALAVLNIQSGARMDSFPAPRPLVPLANTDNDRIYLITETGLVQCLHDADLPDPIYHNADRPAAEKPKEETHKPAAHKPTEHKPTEHKSVEHKEPKEPKEPKARKPKPSKKDAGDNPLPKKSRKAKKDAAGGDAGGLGGGANGPNPFGGGKQ
jgi:cell division septation protein DedD